MNQKNWRYGLLIFIFFCGYAVANTDVPVDDPAGSNPSSGFVLRWYGWLFLTVAFWMLLGMIYSVYNTIKRFWEAKENRNTLRQKRIEKARQRQDDQYSLQLASQDNLNDD